MAASTISKHRAARPTGWTPPTRAPWPRDARRRRRRSERVPTGTPWKYSDRMAYYVLRYDAVVDDYVNRRAPLRAEHLRLIREAHERGEIVMGGAVGDAPEGALIIFRGESPAAAERFATADPYVLNGLVLHWRVQPGHVVVGGQD